MFPFLCRFLTDSFHDVEVLTVDVCLLSHKGTSVRTLTSCGATLYSNTPGTQVVTGRGQEKTTYGTPPGLKEIHRFEDIIAINIQRNGSLGKGKCIVLIYDLLSGIIVHRSIIQHQIKTPQTNQKHKKYSFGTIIN